MYDLTGQRFGKLLVRGRDMSYSGAGQEARWICTCECGGLLSVRSYCLRKQNQQSCGCTQRHVGPTKHGYYNTRTYHTWEQMKQRTTNPKYPNYKYYGARGIRVCPRWQDFENFLEDMGERPLNTSIDRINVNGDYEPGNCRWATPTEQANNKQSSRKELVTSC